MSEGAWQFVEDSLRNVCLYREDERVAVVLGEPELARVRARELVAALNHTEELETDGLTAPKWGIA